MTMEPPHMRDGIQQQRHRQEPRTVRESKGNIQ